ncbi:hypothetical protein EIP91_004152 [Steccherinum ochraceum]|uniref:F-box domain-containing protein n=1 Tax=Steccherinum ochraceum TaxID=92696 RepID=A0A4R0RNL3_9APHY|nr:hypothetical protein EIP91_004152 [Steccherinum ochraceum]
MDAHDATRRTLRQKEEIVDRLWAAVDGPALNWDILSMIAWYLEQRDILSYMRTCRTLHEVGTRTLLFEIQVDEVSLNTVEKVSAFSNFVLNDATRACFIRNMSVAAGSHLTLEPLIPVVERMDNVNQLVLSGLLAYQVQPDLLRKLCSLRTVKILKFLCLIEAAHPFLAAMQSPVKKAFFAFYSFGGPHIYVIEPSFLLQGFKSTLEQVTLDICTYHGNVALESASPIVLPHVQTLTMVGTSQSADQQLASSLFRSILASFDPTVLVITVDLSYIQRIELFDFFPASHLRHLDLKLHLKNLVEVHELRDVLVNLTSSLRDSPLQYLKLHFEMPHKSRVAPPTWPRHATVDINNYVHTFRHPTLRLILTSLPNLSDNTTNSQIERYWGAVDHSGFLVEVDGTASPRGMRLLDMNNPEDAEFERRCKGSSDFAPSQFVF